MLAQTGQKVIEASNQSALIYTLYNLRNALKRLKIKRTIEKTRLMQKVGDIG